MTISVLIIHFQSSFIADIVMVTVQTMLSGFRLVSCSRVRRLKHTSLDLQFCLCSTYEQRYMQFPGVIFFIYPTPLKFYRQPIVVFVFFNYLSQIYAYGLISLY